MNIDEHQKSIVLVETSKGIVVAMISHHVDVLYHHICRVTFCKPRDEQELESSTGHQILQVDITFTYKVYKIVASSNKEVCNHTLYNASHTREH